MDQLCDFKLVKNNLREKKANIYITKLLKHAYVVKFTKHIFNGSNQGIRTISTFEFACFCVGDHTRNVFDFITKMVTVNVEFLNVMLNGSDFLQKQ